MWELEYLTATGRLHPELAEHVGEFPTTGDPAQAYLLMCQIEAEVAPVSGGLSAEAGAVASAVLAGLPHMATATRHEALHLLSQIIGSVVAVGGGAAVEVARTIVAALPIFGAIIEAGSDSEVSEGIDLLAACTWVNEASDAERAVFYLSCIASSHSGAIKASAELELDEARKL